MKSSQEKFVKNKIEKLDRVLFHIENLTKTEVDIFRAINGSVKRSRNVYKQILEELK